MKVQIPSKENMRATNEEDPLEYYFIPIINKLYIKRLKMVLDLIGNEKRSNVLEVGYGSGILFPELNKRFEDIHGVDTHTQTALVYEMLKTEGIEAKLTIGNILDLPYEDNTFDCVVCVSILEHILDLDKACKEIHRVLKPKGIVVIGFPAVNKWMNYLFKMIGGKNIDEQHVSGYYEIYPAIQKRFILESAKSFWSMYFTAKFLKEK